MTTEKPGFAQTELELIYQSAPIGLGLFDAELRFVRINDRLAEINGLSGDAHIGKHVAEVVPDLTDQAEEIRQAFLQGDGPIRKLFTGSTPAQPGVTRHWVEHWSPMRSAEGELLRLNVAVEEVTDQKRQEEKNAILQRELQHRMQNNLAVVQAVAHSTFAEVPEARDALQTFSSRILALSEAHRLLQKSAWERAEVQTLIERCISSQETSRFKISGPTAFLSPDQSMTLALALHELCTNAVKYGALSSESGSVTIEWEVEPHKLKLWWKESGGPEVLRPKNNGFGTRLLDRLLSSPGMSIKRNFQRTGLVCEISFDLEQQAQQHEGGGLRPSSRVQTGD